MARKQRESTPAKRRWVREMAEGLLRVGRHCPDLLARIDFADQLGDWSCEVYSWIDEKIDKHGFGLLGAVVEVVERWDASHKNVGRPAGTNELDHSSEKSGAKQEPSRVTARRLAATG